MKIGGKAEDIKGGEEGGKMMRDMKFRVRRRRGSDDGENKFRGG